MNLWYQYVPKVITSNVGRQILKTQKASPTLLFVGGIAGVIATTVMASRATLQVKATLEEHQENLELAKTLVHKETPKYDQQAYQKDVTILYARMAVDVTKLYAPTIAVGVISIAALTRSHIVLTQRNAALTAAYVALEKGFAEYRRRVINEFGDDVDQRLRHGVATRSIITPEGKEMATVVRNPNDYSIYARFFDETRKDWQEEPGYNMMFLRSQQNFANDRLLSRGHIFLNEVYDMLGIERTKAGAVVGWVVSKDGDNYVDFGIFDHDRERARAFVNGYERAILLDFNVDGVIYDQI